MQLTFYYTVYKCKGHTPDRGLKGFGRKPKGWMDSRAIPEPGPYVAQYIQCGAVDNLLGFVTLWNTANAASQAGLNCTHGRYTSGLRKALTAAASWAPAQRIG
jgi:hypothetical protein